MHTITFEDEECPLCGSSPLELTYDEDTPGRGLCTECGLQHLVRGDGEDISEAELEPTEEETLDWEIISAHYEQTGEPGVLKVGHSFDQSVVDAFDEWIAESEFDVETKGLVDE